VRNFVWLLFTPLWSPSPVLQKVIKDAFKHARCSSVASYYTQVNLLLFYTQVLKLLIFFTLTCKYNSFLHTGVEAGDEANSGLWDLSDQGAAPSGGGRLVGEGSGGLRLALQLLDVQ
jgi:hypothetical protein